MTNTPHSPDDIHNLMDVTQGLSVGHVFLSHLGVPTLVFQQPGEEFTYEDITETEKLLTVVCEEPVVYDGLLHPDVARAKALAMIRENAVDGASS